MPPNIGIGVAVDKSPFFAPSTPRKLVQVSTPGGTSRLVKKRPESTEEHKSTVAGATANLVNAIIGAGVVGIPFAIKETGLVAGVLLVALCAVLTEKSLRVLIDTAKHVGVPSYETLFETTYGTAGFYFISVNMLIMAYGGCLSYLMLIKDTLPRLLGVERGDVGMERAVLTVSTLAIVLPISMQRDMADLAKTSRISVLFQCTMVLIVVVFSPVSASVSENGGLRWIASESVIKTSSLFIGLGVLSFAFVCQHGAFIVAGSLERPTRARWARATGRALFLCLVLEASIGVAGYLAFLDGTKGDILNNFLDVGGPGMERAANAARGLLCTTMFFVYPVDSFVCRHVLVVLFFRGRRAHEGDDTSVLSRRDRRMTITMIVYLSCLVPALLVNDVGPVLAVTGTIGASCLAYIGPGLIYMAVYGEEFLRKVDEIWGASAGEAGGEKGDMESSRLLAKAKQLESPPKPLASLSLRRLAKGAAWHLLSMPAWCLIARMGKEKLAGFREREALKSPNINRLGKCAPLDQPNILQVMAPGPRAWQGQRPRGGSFDGADGGGVDGASKPLHPRMLPYGAVSGGNRAIGAALVAKRQSEGNSAEGKAWDGKEEMEEVDIDISPTWWDFFVAAFFIAFGVVALCAGMVSILIAGSDPNAPELGNDAT